METDKKRHMLLKCFAGFTFVLTAAFLALIAFWLLFPYHPIDTFPKPYKIVYPESKVIKQGGFLTYEFSYNKTSKVIPTIQRQFADGLIFNVASSPAPTVNEAGKGVARVQIDVPETLPPGKYHLNIIATYQMNPIRKFTNSSETEVFEVVAADETPAEIKADLTR